MDDMDIDMDDPEVARLHADIARMDADVEATRAEEAAAAEAANAEAMNGVEEAAEEGEVSSSTPAPTKVHFRGLSQLNTNDVKGYAEEHYSMDFFHKVQWIDDNSANIVYNTEVAGLEALVAFSAEAEGDDMKWRRAKPLSTYPGVELEVRRAIVADVKAPRAKDRSRFYLLNRDWDPDNPDNVRGGYRKRRRPYDEEDPATKYPRYDSNEVYHRRGSMEKAFHEDMYDDDPQAASDARRNSHSSGSGYGRRRANRDEDLFVSRQNGRLRDRSASPGRNGDGGHYRKRSASPDRDGDGRYGFRDDQPRRRTARPRSRTPPEIRAGRDNRGARDNAKKELFPDRKGPSTFTNGHSASSFQDLFSTRPSSSASNNELFPGKLTSTGHRRRIARDLHPDEVADAIGKYSFDGIRERFTYGGSGCRPENSERSGREGGRDLFDRIGGGPRVESSYGRLRDTPMTLSTEERPKEFQGFSLKNLTGSKSNGTAYSQNEFSIKGASRRKASNPQVKELFAPKNGGRDLFDGRMKGSAARRKAKEDIA